MRTIIFALVVAVCCGAVLAADKDSGLVLHYTFDKGAVQDQSGLGNDGKVLGGAKLVTGEFGSAMEFNGTATLTIPLNASVALPEGAGIIIKMLRQKQW